MTETPKHDALSEAAVREAKSLGERLVAVETAVRELRAQFDRAFALLLESRGETLRGPQPPASAAHPATVPPKGDPEKLHQEARRYARLLVSEIELYNPEEVAKGRENKDLYGRLRFHIDRSRRAYDDRFGSSLSGSRNYFHQEIVRLLANNDVMLLGPDYPLPSE